MGEIAEFYEDYWWVQHHIDEHATYERDNLEKGFWRQKNGKRIKISEMTQSHIENTIKAIKEGRIGLHFPKEWIKLLKRELCEK